MSPSQPVWELVELSAERLQELRRGVIGEGFQDGKDKTLTPCVLTRHSERTRSVDVDLAELAGRTDAVQHLGPLVGQRRPVPRLPLDASQFLD